MDEYNGCVRTDVTMSPCDIVGKKRGPDGDDFTNKIKARRKPRACSARVGIAANLLHIV